MKLVDYVIKEEVKNGRIVIDPYKEEDVGPNSVDLHLGPFLITYKSHVLDVKGNNDINEIIIPKEGYELNPGRLYLGSTWEAAGSDFYVPSIDGKSSVARLGIVVHKTASTGSVGFKQNWTLEIGVEQPVRVYAGMPIAQIAFENAVTPPRKPYKGNYVNQGRKPIVPGNLMTEDKALPYSTFEEAIEQEKNKDE